MCTGLYTNSYTILYRKIAPCTIESAQKVAEIWRSRTKTALRGVRRAVKSHAFKALSALVVNRDGGDSGLDIGVKAVVDGQGAVHDGGVHGIVLLLGELGELGGAHRQADAVLGSAELGLLAGVGLAELPAVVQGIGQSLVHGLGQPLRSGGDDRVELAGLVNVNADHLAAVGLRSSVAALADGTAAGKDDLGTLGVPAVHLVLDFIVSGKNLRIPILDMDIVSADLLGSGVSTLHEAVAVADNSGHFHAAQEAQLLVAMILLPVLWDSSHQNLLRSDNRSERSKGSTITRSVSG